MKDINSIRANLAHMVSDLRHTMEEIGDSNLPQASVVTNARDRLNYISTLTEQAAQRTLTATENIMPILHAQQAAAVALAGKTRSAEVKAFLAKLEKDNQYACNELSEIIQAQAYEDLVGQVIKKLGGMVEKLESSLAHLLIEDESDGKLQGPTIRKEDQVSQTDVDDLFG